MRTEVFRPVWRPLAAHRFAVLLGALGGLLLLAPAFGTSARGEGALGVLFSAFVFGLALAAKQRRIVAATVAAIWLVLIWLRPFGEPRTEEIDADAALLVLCLVAIESVLRHVFSARTVTPETLCAAVVAYLLMGVCWAVAYTILETIAPSSFDLAGAAELEVWNALFYFSFVTLTTLGYGDVLPLTQTARTLAMVEAVGGTLYLAIMIARLVSIYRNDRPTDAD